MSANRHCLTLIGKRLSITNEQSGTTRDRLYHTATIGDKEFYLIDTGGIQYAAAEGIDALVDREVNKAIVEAAVIIFLCDITGLTSLDYQLADDLRRREKKVIFAVNKAYMRAATGPLHEFYAIGMGEPLFVSAMHGDSLGELCDAVYAALPQTCTIPARSVQFRLAIVGEPNAGKSTLLNGLLQRERAVVSDVPGTTRDSIEEYIEHEGNLIALVDTAGIKKKKKLDSAAAVFSLARARDSIKHSDVIMLLIDAQRGPQQDTRAIYRMIRDEHKGCIVVINKWDTVKGMPMEDYAKRLMRTCGFLAHTPVCFISATTGRNLDQLMQCAWFIWERLSISIPTSELNAFLQDLKAHNPPPAFVKFKYIVQGGTKPPTFLLFVKHKKNVTTAYLQYVINELIRVFSLQGVLPRLVLKEEDTKR